jgi:hypothetical protein
MIRFPISAEHREARRAGGRNQNGYSLRRDDRALVVFCSAEVEDAQAFAERFRRERLPVRREGSRRG